MQALACDLTVMRAARAVEYIDQWQALASDKTGWAALVRAVSKIAGE